MSGTEKPLRHQDESTYLKNQKKLMYGKVYVHLSRRYGKHEPRANAGKHGKMDGMD